MSRRRRLHSHTIPCANVKEGFRPDHIHIGQTGPTEDAWITIRGYCKDLGRGSWISLPFDIDAVAGLHNACQDIVGTYEEPRRVV